MSMYFLFLSYFRVWLAWTGKEKKTDISAGHGILPFFYELIKFRRNGFMLRYKRSFDLFSQLPIHSDTDQRPKCVIRKCPLKFQLGINYVHFPPSQSPDFLLTANKILLVKLVKLLKLRTKVSNKVCCSASVFNRRLIEQGDEDVNAF